MDTSTKVASVLSELNTLQTQTPQDEKDEKDEKDKEEAGRWSTRIENQRDFLADNTHSIVFIGNVGVGKSSLVGMTANLFIGVLPTNKTSLKNQSIMPIGAGRTTVCEVHIRCSNPDDKGKTGLIVEPVTLEEMEQEIAFYAESALHRRQAGADINQDKDTEIIPQEIQRVILNMTDYAPYSETVMVGDKKHRRMVVPLDSVLAEFDTPKKLSAHLIARAKLAQRTENEWWYSESTDDTLHELKALFQNINEGKENTALLPSRITVVTAEPLIGNEAKLNCTLLDTRGLDGPVEARSDIFEHIQNPRTLLVLCTNFREAPGDSIRTLLHTMTSDAELRQAISRTMLVLIDQDDATQVNGAEGDRELGQTIKIDECYRDLENAGLADLIAKDRIMVVDVLQHDIDRFQAALSELLSTFRQKKDDELTDTVTHANAFLENVKSPQRLQLYTRIAEAIKAVIAQHPLPQHAPLSDPLSGAYSAINRAHHASVYASCRRQGKYKRLDLYAAVRAMASQQATQQLDKLLKPIIEKLDALEEESSYQFIKGYIVSLQHQYRMAQREVVRDYADRINDQVLKVLKPSTVWNQCAEEWGKGLGFKDRVKNHLREWATNNQDLTAHEITRAVEVIPFLAEVIQPAQAPQFTLHVRNLRTLRQVAWTPSQLNVVIGANGSGKTTLLLVLKLLKHAYEHTLPDAVATVLGGSRNLKTWGADEADPITLGIDIAPELHWELQLVPSQGTVATQTHERLTYRSKDIFVRDALGGFSYAGESIVATDKLGLRILMDRGVNDPAVRQMALFIQRIAVYRHPDLWTLREQGSNSSENRTLDARGSNAIAVLRRWHQERANQHRYQFVIEGLKAAFPNLVEALDFEEAGKTLVARLYHPHQKTSSFLEDEADGVTQLLVVLCCIAHAEDEHLVAIDEPENYLHPYALRAFIGRTRRWANQHNLTVLLATHSTVILDELSRTPEQVYVMKLDEPERGQPIRLDELYNREWLQGFGLGDLYKQGEIGSNEDEIGKC